ncbi:MAG TPA: glutamate 5-kinase [Chroococcales cyanobacterium]|jgi:glutamate 5-kinase
MSSALDVRVAIRDARRIVFKFGTNVLSRPDGQIALSRVYSYIESLADLHKEGKEIIIVTSGAVGLGARALGMKKPELVTLKQACAAVGQGQLMAIYQEGFARFSISAAQILLTEEDFSIRRRYLSLRNTLNALLELKAIPIVNENDTISTSEIECYRFDGIEACFGDNDKLSALVMSKLDADLLVILSDVDGLYDADPRESPSAHVIPVVSEITPEIEALGFAASKGGRGGMKTKIETAKVAVRSGGLALIANGKAPDVIRRIFSGEEMGTVFLPIEHLSSKKRWIAYATTVFGRIKVNEGAKNALLQHNASLLPAGIVGIENEFASGDVVSILDERGHEFSRGITNYSSEECRSISGLKSGEIDAVLGYKNYDEVVLRDNIVLL